MESRGDIPTDNSLKNDLSSYDLCLSIVKGLGLSESLEKSMSSVSATVLEESMVFIVPF